ncbi:MAG TPA: helicase-related protein [Myxococcota bacterium]|nr:helicase-related protein [Myxococcota bacterium]
MTTPAWREGSKLVHPYNPELGVGFVRRVEGRYLVVYFPAVEREVTMAAQGAGLVPMILPPGAPAIELATSTEVRIASWDGERYVLADGRRVEDKEIWPLEQSSGPIERLAQFRLDRMGSFRNRIEGLQLRKLREAGGLGSFLGGRIALFPHQLHTALAAVRTDPVRWLLADEVGLGKTIVACLILSALIRTGRAKRALVIAPSTLTVQWLGELYRKFHQVFVLIDEARIESVERDYGEGNNPFDVHPFGVVSMEDLAADPALARQARNADLDLVIVDEAHRLALEHFDAAVAPLVKSATHSILLTATPLSADKRGFFHLLQLLHPESFASFEAFDAAVGSGGAVFPCTSAVRRSDLGGLPPRKPEPVDVAAFGKDPRKDPRTEWLSARVREWHRKKEKALVFVHDLDRLEKLKKQLEQATRTHIAVFHESLTPAQRDIEVARFRETHLPVLICTEAGAEGRNFQFCDRMVHYDLPSDPVALEQRIGRLDRIGRTKDVEIVYFRGAHAQPDVARLYERLDLFARPSAGLDLALAGVRAAVERAQADESAIDVDALVAEIDAARAQQVADIPRVIYRDAYDASQAERLLALVPPELEQHMRRFCLGAANDLGLKIVEKGGTALYYLEMGTSLTVESLPGVRDESRWLGTFDRVEALEKDELEFFASGHPLVEGLLLELEDGVRGRAAMFTVPSAELRGAGVICVFKDGPDWSAVVFDTKGEPRPEWAPKIVESLGKAKAAKPEELGLDQRATEGIRELGSMCELEAAESAVLEAAAFFRFVPESAPGS